MSKELKEVLDLLKANEERGKGLAPLAETAEQSEIDAREAELNQIAEERNALIQKKEALEAEERVAQQVNKNPAIATEIENKRGENVMKDSEIRNTTEYVDAYARSIANNDNKFKECRALLTENATNGTVPVPEFVYEIVKNAWEREGIMRRVRKAYLKGNLKVGFEISSTGATAHTEGGDAVSEETLVLGTINITPSAIMKWISVSQDSVDIGMGDGEEFLRYIYDELTYQIAKKAVDDLLALIVAAGTASTSTAVGLSVYTSSTISVGLAAQAIALLSDQAADPIIVMNKATWGDMKAAQYANKFSVDPFEGLDVEFNNSIKSFSAASTGDTYMIVGDFGEGAIANFPNGEDITMNRFQDKELITKDLVGIMGRVSVGLGIVGPNAFVRIQK